MRRLLVSLLAALTLLSVPASAALADEPQQLDVIIALDLSGSMTSERLRPAVQAATSFVRQLPDSVRCGLVTFSSDAKLVLAPTSDRDLLVQKLEEARAYGKTALYDGIQAALEAVSASGAAHVIVFSDGRDTVSQRGLDDLLATLGTVDTTVSVIALEPEPEQVTILEQIVERGRGQLIQPEGAEDFFDAFIAALTPPSPSPSPTPKPEDSAVFDWPDWTPSALALAFAVGLLAVVWSTRGRVEQAVSARTLHRLVNSYSEVSAPKRKPEAKDRLKELRSRLGDRFPKIALRLDQAQLNVTVEAWLAVVAGTGFFSFLFLNGFTGSAPLAFFASLFIAARGPRGYLQRRINKRMSDFEDALPTLLSVVSSSLRAGLTFAQALETAVAEDQQEMGRQMRRALTEMRVGATLDEALMRVAERMQSEDLKWAVTGLAIQREVGGSLSKILDTSAEAIRSRAELRREVRTLSAEGRLSAYVLAGLPVVIFLFLGISRPDYIAVFWTEPIGVLMMIVMLGAFFAGWTWLNKIVKIKV